MRIGWAKSSSYTTLYHINTMKVHEILSLVPELLKVLHDFGIKTEDYIWLSIYRDYAKMKSDGDKTSYIIACLSERYRICERKVYKIIKIMEKDCSIDAVR